MARPLVYPQRFEIALRPEQVAALRLHAAALGTTAPDLVRHLLDRHTPAMPGMKKRRKAHAP